MIELCWCNAFIHFISFVTTGCQSGKLLLRSQVAPKPEKIDISANQARNQTGEKLSSVVLFVTNYFNIQGILKYTWELTPERNPSNVQYAKSHLPRQQLLKIITKHTLEKNHLHVLCALKHSLGQDIWSRIQERETRQLFHLQKVIFHANNSWKSSQNTQKKNPFHKNWYTDFWGSILADFLYTYYTFVHDL